MTRNNKEDFSKLRAAAPDLSFANRLFSFWSKVVTMWFEFLSCLLSHLAQLTSKWQMFMNRITFSFKTLIKFLAASFHQNFCLPFSKQISYFPFQIADLPVSNWKKKWRKHLMNWFWLPPILDEMKWYLSEKWGFVMVILRKPVILRCVESRDLF